MEFKNHVDEIVKMELTAALGQKNVVIEHDFRSMIQSKYGFSDITVVGALRRMHPEIGLTKRHLTNELKNFYSLNISGYPIAYISK